MNSSVYVTLSRCISIQFSQQIKEEGDEEGRGGKVKKREEEEKGLDADKAGKHIAIF